MANTFKVVTKAGVTSADVIYTVAGSTTTVVLGMMVLILWITSHVKLFI